MKGNNYWGKARASHVNVGLIVRLSLALIATVGSAALAWVLLGSHQGAHAAGYTEFSTATQPWGVTFDQSGHIWIAEPGCDASPVCTAPPVGGAIEGFNTSNGALYKSLTTTLAQNINPVFLIVDGNNKIWFTDPSHNAIGELDPSLPTWTMFTTGITANSAPYDLVLDKLGNIWFTEHNGNKIGFFNTTTHAVVETAVPTANSNPHGITMDRNGNIWFTENGVAKIGSFTPSANGAITIAEYAVTQVGPHLIAADPNTGVIWYSEGFTGQVGNFNPNDNTHFDFSVSLNLCPPASPGTTPPPCPGTHISGIAVDNNGLVWFDDSLSNRVGFLNPAGCAAPQNCTVTTLTVANNPHTHDGLGIDGTGNVWFAEQYNSKFGDIPAGSLTPAPTATATTPPTSPPSPVNKTWYFAEGRVGKGFKEYLTLGNPLSTPCSVNVQYMLAPDSGSPSTKTVPVTVPGGSRVTQYVNNDLSVPQSQSTGVSVSAIVQVNTTATPNCTGIVAERPMYFNALGVNSGDDVMGATHTATNFFFADIPTGSGYSSFITILNPGTSPATVTVTYYSGSVSVKTQKVTVAPTSRGTINPNGIGLAGHVAAVVVSTQPVVVERPDYFSNINGGNAGTVSGAAVLNGATTLAPDWLFAEGYTGTHYQEKLVIANLDTVAKATASVKIKLDLVGGGTAQVFSLSLAKLSQVIWDVNAAVGPNRAVSAEVLSMGANIVVEREMFFQSSFTVNGMSSVAIGGSEVNGQVGPASHSSYSFAEGYTNTGYKEWLTLQNPTASTETIYVTLVNGYGRTYTYAASASPNSRTTVDINGLVVAHLLHSGDKYPGYEVSMTVQTSNGAAFVAERPMYWNASGTQGGSVAIGYIGGPIP